MRFQKKTLSVAILIAVMMSLYGNSILVAQEDWPGAGTNSAVQWVGYRYANTTPVQDPPGDAGSNSDKWDLTFVNPGAPFTLQAAASTGTAFFRLQVKSLTMLNGPGTYFVFLGSIANVQLGYVYLTLSGNNTGTIAVSNGQSTTQITTNLTNYTRVSQSGYGSTAYVDFQVPLTSLYSALQINPQTTVKFYAGTSTGAGNFGNINLDFMTSGNTLDFSLLATASFSNITLGVLPVELTTFTARYYDGRTELRWETASELNNYGFEVQRSTGGGEWSVIGFVAGAGTVHTPRRYEYVDHFDCDVMPLQYRLRQIDRDGREELSEVVEIHCVVLPDVSVTCHPHPVRGEATVTCSLPEPGAARVFLVNVLGREVRLLGEVSTVFGKQFSFPLERGGLPNGQYYLVLTHPQGQAIHPLILAD